MMAEDLKKLDEYREMLLAKALQVAGNVLVYSDEGELSWCGHEEQLEIAGTKFDINVQYSKGHGGVRIAIQPTEPEVTAKEVPSPLGEIQILIQEGGMAFTVPVLWIQTLIRVNMAI